uniref:Protein kinase domain-containing protein n=1 Tax=viral metagenome TaxID=1070528 RepID=A0A6C0HTG7_9ZZZZ
MNRIKKTMKSLGLPNKQTRKNNFSNITTICPDTNICFAFGIESKSITQYFDDFDDFDLVVEPIVKIGVHSQNGFLQELEFNKNNYRAYAVLKSSVRSKADNLYYEYLIGQKLNLYHKFIPSLIETFNIYQYQNKIAWEYSKNNSMLNDYQMEFLFKNLKNITDLDDPSLILKSCERSKYLAIMIQLIKPAINIKRLLNDSYFNDYLLLPIIFQIYTSLYSLRKMFTHYDLHYENIILYSPKPNTYIHYHYHVGNTVVSFKSPYMVKIIDYGRSYFDVGNIYDQICQLCEECGVSVGYQWLSGKENDPNSYYITPRFLNNSADLRFLYDVKRKVKFPNIHLSKMLNIRYSTRYGTPEDLTSVPNEIRNITDAFNMICQVMTSLEVLKMNDMSVSKMQKFCDLEIFVDMSQPMKFTKGRN